MALPDPLITSDPKRLGGTPVFAGTRVPAKTLFDYIEAGDPLDRFLNHFPDVPREHAVAVLHEAAGAIVRSAIARADGSRPENLPTADELSNQAAGSDERNNHGESSLSDAFRNLASKFPPLSRDEVRRLREQGRP